MKSIDQRITIALTSIGMEKGRNRPSAFEARFVSVVADGPSLSTCINCSSLIIQIDRLQLLVLQVEGLMQLQVTQFLLRLN